MTTFWQDIRYGLRRLRASPGFTPVAVFTLAVGIGATTAILSVAHKVLFEPLPVAQPDRFVQLVGVHQRGGWSAPGINPPALREVQEQTSLFARLGIYEHDSLSFQGEDFAEQESGARVTPSFFAMFPVAPRLGRTFAADEGSPGRDDTIILSQRLWRQRFGSDPAILGRVISCKERSLTVVGVMPAHFCFPNAHTGYWRPFDGPHPSGDLSPGSGQWLMNTGVIAQLQPHVQHAGAQAFLDIVSRRQVEANPMMKDFRLEARRVTHLFTKPELRRTLWALLGASVLTLLIACVNVANLQLARTETRQRELGVRAALGAGHVRIVRQLLTESLLLACLGGLMGLWLTHFGLHLLETRIPPELPRFRAVTVDVDVLGIALLVSVLTGVIFGLIPAWQAGRRALTETLKLGAASTTRALSKAIFSRTLIVVQMSLSLILLTVRSTVEPGLLHKAIGRELKAAGADRALPFFEDVGQALYASTAGHRAMMLYLSVFAGVGLMLAAVGFYGVLAYTIAQRTREIGVRMAMGARPCDVVRLLVGQGMKLAAFGAALGLGGSLAATRLVRSQLFQIGAYDPLTLAVVTVLLGVVAMAACWLPARRAARIDPMAAMRSE